MDVPVSQAWALKVSADDPWHFTEDIVFGEGGDEWRYLMRWKVDGHHIAALSAVTVVAPGQAPADDVPDDVSDDASSDFDVTVKWDGCCDWPLSPAHSGAAGGYGHPCHPPHVAALAGAVVYAQRRGLEVLKARERLAIFG